MLKNQTLLHNSLTDLTQQRAQILNQFLESKIFLNDSLLLIDNIHKCREHILFHLSDEVMRSTHVPPAQYCTEQFDSSDTLYNFIALLVLKSSLVNLETNLGNFEQVYKLHTIKILIWIKWLSLLPKFVCHVENAWISSREEFSYQMAAWQDKLTLDNLLALPTGTRCEKCATAFLLPLLQHIQAYFLKLDLNNFTKNAKSIFNSEVCLLNFK